MEPARLSSLEGGKFGAQLLTFANGEKGVLKTKPFATNSFRGIPKQDLPKREVAAYMLDRDVLDFGVVPETILTRWQGREASVQKFIVSGLMPRDLVSGLFDKQLDDWKYRIAKFFTKVALEDMQKVVLLDLIMNNVDRHGKNILVDPVLKKTWAIDNGLAFGRYYRNYRSIFHKYLYYAKLHVPKWAVEKLSRVTRDQLDKALLPYLPPLLINDTWLRIKFILDHRDRLAYKRFSGRPGLGNNDVPSYEDWFKRQIREQNTDTALVFVQ